MLSVLTPCCGGQAETTPSGVAIACAPAPRADCREARKTRLLLEHTTADELVWKWLQGEATTLADFGSPVSSTSFALCLYARDAAVATVAIPGGSPWRQKGAKSYQLAASGVGDGIQNALLESGAAGKSRIVLKGRGPSLLDGFRPPLALPVTVQLVNDTTGACFESVLTSASRNDGTRFKARAKVGRTRQYAIGQASDCERIGDYPYARNLFCPGAFAAVRTVVSEVAESLGAEQPSRGYFYYYQTRADPQDPPDDQSQTRTPCLLTEAPWGSTQVAGAGTPLCHLVAYVTSPGPVDVSSDGNPNPVPATLRAFPDYFTRLYAPASESLVDEFQAGAAFDPIVSNLSARASDAFRIDYPSFSTDALYDPASWRSDPQYAGVSGGGGGGWGGEISLALPGEGPRVLLAFGGGGGGGMTSTTSGGVTTSHLGGGGGGGMQLADDYSSGGRSYAGLGLGAGTSSEDDVVQYAYRDYAGSGRPPRPVHEYDPDVIVDYQTQMSELVNQLQAGLQAGGTVVVRGGGGMGAGTEYLRPDGDEYVPHALSTQAGFSFRYAFRSEGGRARRLQDDEDVENDAYSQLGEFYRKASARALAACGDYSNFACICRTQHSIVIASMTKAVGDASKVPAWMKQSHCPGDPESPDE